MIRYTNLLALATINLPGCLAVYTACNNEAVKLSDTENLSTLRSEFIPKAHKELVPGSRKVCAPFPYNRGC